VTLPVGALGPSAYWYLTRGSGAVALILLSASTVLGIVDQRRWRSERWPRFALDALHQTASLLAMAFLVVHILTSVLDSFAPISLLDAVVPFAGRYRPIWLGLGTLSFDLLLAVTITSILRRRIGHATWRLVHWLAYASWPVAVVHGLGTGSDVKATWLLVLTIACVAAVLAAVGLRVASALPRLRPVGVAPLLVGALALALWLPHGPLGKGWARRAGTPTKLLLAGNVTVASTTTASDRLALPFSGNVSGTVRQSQEAGGLESVDLSMSFPGGVADVLLEGQAAPGGGVSVTSSRVTMGTSTSPRLYRGRVVELNGGRLVARVRDSSGSPARVDLALSVDSGSATVTGSISGRAGA
jgi:Ferric reductase like transmembrane component